MNECPRLLHKKCCAMPNSHWISSYFNFKERFIRIALSAYGLSEKVRRRTKQVRRELEFSHASSDTMKTFSIRLEWRAQKKEASMIDGFVNSFGFFSSHYGLKVLFALFNLVVRFFFVFVKEIPIACNLSSMNSFSFLFFVLFEWSNGIRLCNFQMWVSNWNDLTTYQHDSWVLFCSTLILHVRSPDNETFFTCLVIETERNKKCIM